MDNQQRQGRELTPEEDKELRDGQAVEEMSVSSAGWKVLEEILKGLAFHSWVDPRECNQEDFQWREINAFHAANNAKELLETIQTMTSRAQYLSKVKSGEVPNRTMRV